MTNEELNRKISEAREPKPVYRSDAVDILIEPVWSEGGNWHIISVYDHGDEVEQFPRDWTGSEDASAVLLEEMPLPMVYRSTQDGVWRCRSNHRSGDWAMLGIGPSRKEAIAEAWLKWKERP